MNVTPLDSAIDLVKILVAATEDPVEKSLLQNTTPGVNEIVTRRVCRCRGVNSATARLDVTFSIFFQPSVDLHWINVNILLYTFRTLWVDCNIRFRFKYCSPWWKLLPLYFFQTRIITSLFFSNSCRHTVDNSVHESFNMKTLSSIFISTYVFFNGELQY